MAARRPLQAAWSHGSQTKEGCATTCVLEGVKPLPFPEQASGAVTRTADPEVSVVRTGDFICKDPNLSPFYGWGRRSPERLSGPGRVTPSFDGRCD